MRLEKVGHGVMFTKDQAGTIVHCARVNENEKRPDWTGPDRPDKTTEDRSKTKTKTEPS